MKKIIVLLATILLIAAATTVFADTLPSGYVASGRHGTGINIFKANGGNLITSIITSYEVLGVSFAPNGDIYYTGGYNTHVYKASYIGDGVWGAETLYASIPSGINSFYGAFNLAAKLDGTVFVGTFRSDQIYKITPGITPNVTKIVGITGELGFWDMEISPEGVTGDFWADRQTAGLKNYYADGTDAGFNLVSGYDYIRGMAFANGKLYAHGNSNDTIYEYNPNDPNSGTPYITFADFNTITDLREVIQSAAYGPDANGDGYGDFYFKHNTLDGRGDAWVLTTKEIFVYSGAPGLTPTTRFMTKIESPDMWLWAIDTFPKGNQSAPSSYSLTGTVNLLSYDADKTLVTGTIELGDTSYPLVLDGDGKFTITDITPGTYAVRIKASHWLAKTTADVAVTENIIMDTVTLINGDIVDNNEVDFSDINAVRSAYGSFPGDNTWNEQADVDGSGEVDFTDINIVRGNYGEIGD